MFGRFDIVIHLHSLCLRCLSSLRAVNLRRCGIGETSCPVNMSSTRRLTEDRPLLYHSITRLRSGRAHFVRTILFIYFAAGREEERSEYMLVAAIAATVAAPNPL